MTQVKTITVEGVVHAPIEKVWQCWTEPKHIIGWAFASDDWEAPSAENDIRIGGKFLTRMSSKDKSAGFDFTGTYTNVKEHELIEYTMDGDDARKVRIEFVSTADGILVRESFDIEHENSEEMQRAGWQSILDNFKKYTESH